MPRERVPTARGLAPPALTVRRLARVSELQVTTDVGRARNELAVRTLHTLVVGRASSSLPCFDRLARHHQWVPVCAPPRVVRDAPTARVVLVVATLNRAGVAAVHVGSTQRCSQTQTG